MGQFSLTNKMVVEICQALFASSKAVFNFPNANRVKSRKQLEAHIAAGQPDVAYISDFQGAGKSTLIEMATNTFGFKSKRASMVRARDVTVERLIEDLSVYDSLFVDDADIRIPWQKTFDGLKRLAEFAAEHPCPVIVCGDFTVRNDDVRALFADRRQSDVVMEPVDQKFFIEAINERLRYLFPERKDDIPSDVNLAFAPDLLECLVPMAAQPIATFREVLTLAEGISQQIEPTEEEFRLTREHAASYCDEKPLSGASAEQWKFVWSFLLPYVTERYPYGRAMVPFTAADVLADSRMIELSEEECNATILEPLCAAGFLHALGIPASNGGSFKRYPGPYVPRPLFLLHAYAGTQNWPDATS
jgi:hypothetical protein